MKGGQFKFTKKVPVPELYGLSIDTTSTPLYLFLDKGPVTVKLDSAHYYNNSVVSGSPLQQKLAELLP